ncbi:MAG: PRC-barrel domain-containing protein, partial [Allorhizobium sp.]
SEQQAEVQYEAEEAQVRVNRAEGEPEVRFEETEQATAQQRRTEETAETRTAAAANEQVDPENTAAVEPQGPREGANIAIGVDAARDVPLTVADIKNYDIVGANGNNLGDIEEVVSVNDRLYAVVTSGGFLGLGKNRAAVPLSSLYVTDEQTLLGPNVTEQQIDGMANFDSTDYPNLPNDHTITLGAR